jgi:hypothetical protein
LSEAERSIRRDEGLAENLRINALDVKANIVGRTADVTVEMLIGSEGAGSYEANLALTLPADAVVTGYALDVGGRMIPGQLLEAPKARNVYEDEVRAGVDPGLAEVDGNRFTTRIFPIDVEHPRRFHLQFSAPFDPSVGLVLPFARDAAIGPVTVAVTAHGYADAPAVRFAGQPLNLVRDGDGWRGDAALGRATVREGLTITGGTSAEPMLITRHSSGQVFFVLGDGTQTRSVAPPRSGRLRIYWDRSLSHRAARTDLEADLLVRLAAQTTPTAIDLVTFASDQPRITTLRNAAALKVTLSNITYRGGSSLAGLDTLSLPKATQCVLLFDGQVTLDRSAGLAPDCSLMAVTAASGADGGRLGRLTQGTGGSVIHLIPGGETEAITALTGRKIAPVSVRDTKGRRINVRALPAGPGQWLLVGPIPTGDVIVRLNNGEERRYSAAGAPIATDAPGALWATDRVAELADDPAHHAAMVETARRYQVAGPGMSFLVLETPEQYLRADLSPPEGFSVEWLAQYREARQDWDKEHRDDRQKRLAFVLDEWRERRIWWNKRFSPLSSIQLKRNRVAPPPPPPAPPPPNNIAPAPPPVAALPRPQDASGMIAADQANDAGDLIVTGTRREPSPVAQARQPVAIKLDLANLIADRPYILALDNARPAMRLTVLAEQERQYGSVPAFYLDTAEWFRLKGDAASASLLLLSALELPTSDDETRQIVAFRLERDCAFDRSVEIAEHLAAANAVFRPQPARGLALALMARGLAAGGNGRADLERAFQLLVDTALNPAFRDFDGIEVIALMEANALIPMIEAAGGHWRLDPRLVGLTDTDARIVIEWTADDADIDLWVDEPDGERVMYSNKLSSAGGQISNDMTDGYGPEEYAIHRAPSGPYRVHVNGYDADRINPNGPGHVLIRLQRNFARIGSAQELVDVDLSFQAGRNRNVERKTVPVATLQVAR